MLVCYRRQIDLWLSESLIIVQHNKYALFYNPKYFVGVFHTSEMSFHLLLLVML